MGIFKNYLNLLKNKKRLVSLISPLLLFGSIPLVYARISEPEPIELRYAERFVYKVYGASASGSGLMVLLPDGEIALLTAKHVISGMSPKEEIEIIASNDKSIYIESSKALFMPDYDLAFVLIDRKELENLDHKFYLTEIETDKTLVGQKVSVLGYPLSDSSIVNKARISPGVIQTMGDDNKIKDGYSLGYSSKTYVGMSGGGVFNSSGKLIGIHGRGEALKSNDINKTGTNYAVLINDAIKYYRSTMQVNTSDMGLTDASRSVLDGNFKDALKIWKKVKLLYPDSTISKYNVDCLTSITENKKLKKDNYPKIFNADYRQSLVQGSKLENKEGFYFEYKNDPLVKKLTNKSEVESLDPMAMMSSFGLNNISGISSMPSMTDTLYPMKVSDMLSIMQRDTAPFFERANIKGKKDRCLIFITHKGSQAMDPPFLIETMVTPLMRP